MTRHFCKRAARFLVAGFVAACFGLAGSPATAQQVVWGSPVGLASYTSRGADYPVDASFTFELGTFVEADSPGWTPTPANVAEWEAHWMAVGSAGYHEALEAVTGASAVPPELAGRQGFIWGFDSKSGGAEWVLLTNPSWVFPSDSGGGGLAFPESWQTSGATQAILGEVDPSPGSSPHLRTVAVEFTPPAIPNWEWVDTHFTETQRANPSVGSWTADPDGDGMSNLLEFATGNHPLEFNRDGLPRPSFIESSGQHYLALSVQKAPGTTVVFDAEVSSDLRHWERGSPYVTVVQETETEIQLRDSSPFHLHRARFIRLCVTLPETP